MIKRSEAWSSLEVWNMRRNQQGCNRRNDQRNRKTKKSQTKKAFLRKMEQSIDPSVADNGGQ